MFRAGDAVGVAVSGGADSVSLLLLLRDLQAELGIHLSVLHFNHQLRGVESDGDEQFVAALAARHHLEFIADCQEVAAQARKTNSNLEDAARKCRYGFFARLVSEGRVGRVAVAHSADDLAETVLAKIIRGTGLAGLAGIYPVAGYIVRPLIEVRRAELRDFLRGRGITWREDATNFDESRLRARIRARLLPLLESEFQPTIVGQLSNLSTLARQDEEFWQVLVEERFQSLVRREGGSLQLSVINLLAPLDFPATVPAGMSALKALSTKLVRRILGELKGDLLGFTGRHVEDVLHLASASTSGHQVTLPFGISVERCFDELRFLRRSPRDAESLKKTTAFAPEFQRLLDLDGHSEEAIDIPDIRARLHLKVIDWPTAARDTKQEATVADFGCLRPPLVVRNWLPGDAFRPQGRLRTHKLKHLLRERRVALRERHGWPVLTSNGELVWARGFPVAEKYVTDGKTRRALVISEEPI
ncbi:MAG: tRNA lysidine(34) synthetase TilS [Candidatus Acidiferrales bacterium]